MPLILTFLVLTKFSPWGECHAYLVSACRNPWLGMSVVIMTGGSSWHESGRWGQKCCSIPHSAWDSPSMVADAGEWDPASERLSKVLMWFKPPGLISTFHLVEMARRGCLLRDWASRPRQTEFISKSQRPPNRRVSQPLSLSCSVPGLSPQHMPPAPWVSHPPDQASGAVPQGQSQGPGSGQVAPTGPLSMLWGQLPWEARDWRGSFLMSDAVIWHYAPVVCDCQNPKTGRYGKIRAFFHSRWETERAQPQWTKAWLLLQKLNKGPVGTWKNAQHDQSSEKHQSKPQWGITSPLSQWLSSKSLPIITCWWGCGEKGTVLPCW